MTHGSLFSGIGGFDTAAQWMEWENVFNCEIDPFCQQVLKYYHPDAIQYNNIKTTDFTIHRGGIDILTGGFPCQPASSAGKRKGTSDDRWLWPEMLRAIREIQPGYVVAENVRGLLSLERGLVFDTVLSDLEAEGYEVIPFLLPACALNAPHRRDRIWIVAHAVSDGHGNELREGGRTQKEKQGTQQREEWCKLFGKRNGDDFKRTPFKGPSSDTSGKRFEVGTQGKRRAIQSQAKTFQGCELSRTFTKTPGWQDFPTQSPICGRNDGISTGLSGITVSKHRKESIKGYGNTIVPQIAFEIFKALVDSPIR